MQLLRHPPCTNQNNLKNIRDGIDKLHSVYQEAGNLGKLQTESGDKTRMVAESSENTVEHSKQVLQMVNQMQTILENTVNQANQIVKESETPKNAAKEVEISFHQVNAVSQSLLEISR